MDGFHEFLSFVYLFCRPCVEPEWRCPCSRVNGCWLTSRMRLSSRPPSRGSSARGCRCPRTPTDAAISSSASISSSRTDSRRAPESSSATASPANETRRSQREIIILLFSFCDNAYVFTQSRSAKSLLYNVSNTHL